MNPFNPSDSAVLITAAGNSTRMKAGTKKEYRLIEGVPVLRLVFDAFLNTDLFSSFLITCPPGEENRIRTLLGNVSSDITLFIISGGSTRRESVYKGLQALKVNKPEWVLIHDGSRPWVTAELILQVLENTRTYGACVPVVPPIDTLITLDDSPWIDSYIEREVTGRVQTPQGFSFHRLLEGHTRADADGAVYTDDSEIYNRYCGRVYTIPGDPVNRKITYPWDI